MATVMVTAFVKNESRGQEEYVLNQDSRFISDCLNL